MSQNAPVIAPFRGIRYNLQTKDLSRVTAPPYDVISAEGQQALHDKDPHNIVRLDLGQGRGSDSDADNRYTRSAAMLQSWIKEGFLIQDADPAYYLYEQIFEADAGKGHSEIFVRRGFFALRRLEEFEGGRIRPHEKTLSGPKEDRLLLMKATGMNLSPIFFLYDDPKQVVADLLKKHFEEAPLADFIDEAGVRQRFWRVQDADLFRATDEVLGGRTLLIADGHHRYETALNYRRWILSQNPGLPQNHPIHYVMAFFADMADPGMIVLPTHRILKNDPLDAADFRARLEKWFEFTTFQADNDNRKPFLDALKGLQGTGPAFGLLLANDPREHLILLSQQGKDACQKLIQGPLQEIDTAILHRMIFQELLGLDDQMVKEKQYVAFVKEAEEVFDARQKPDFRAGFILNSQTIAMLKRVMDQGMILPPKTTFFYPKLLTGLLINSLSSHPS